MGAHPGPPGPAPGGVRRLAGWPAGTVSALGTAAGETPVDDLFALDLAAVADTATARRGSLGRAVLVASLHAARLRRRPRGAARRAARPPGALPDHRARRGPAGRPDHPGRARRTPRWWTSARAPSTSSRRTARWWRRAPGELLTAAVAEHLGLPRAAADWVKRGPCVRVTGSQRFEAEDGSRGFLDRPAAATALGMLAAPRPGRPAAVRPRAQPGRVAGHPAPAQGGGVRRQPAPRAAHAQHGPSRARRC